MPIHLTERDPRVPADRLVAEMVPPPRFADVRFDTYIPDPGQPSQAQAVDVLRAFAGTVGERPRKRRWGRAKDEAGPGGVYLDGGYGVGKTHLLASLWHTAPGPKLFGTFVELTNLVGALGFHDAVAALSSYTLLCVDEFELDDPGDTVLVSTLLSRLREAGVRLAATSNTLPGKLGEGRFATADFLREIQGLSAHFGSLRIDGEDYRHRGLPEAPAAPDLQAVRRAAEREGASLDDFVDLTRHLAQVHPSRYGALLDGVRRCAWRTSAPSTTRPSRCGWWCSRTGCTTGTCRWWPAASPSTRCSRRRCWRAATARSTSGRSAGWWPWPARARTSRPEPSRRWAHCSHGEVETAAAPPRR